MLTTKCPWCRGKALASGDRLWQCTNCKRLFDDDPTEGGDFSDHNPALRLEREERERQRCEQQLGSRRKH